MAECYCEVHCYKRGIVPLVRWSLAIAWTQCNVIVVNITVSFLVKIQDSLSITL